MKDVILIYCYGEQVRWANHLGRKKHFIQIDNESILHRTVRLIHKYSPNDHSIFIVGSGDEYVINGTQLITPVKNPGFADADKYLNSLNYWNRDGRTVIFFGDTYWTQDAIKKVLNYNKKEWFMFGRPRISKITGCRYASLFAVVLWNHEHETFQKHLLKIVKEYHEGKLKRTQGWELYRSILGFPPTDIMLFNGHFKLIDDFTQDFDFPEDYERFIIMKHKQPPSEYKRIQKEIKSLNKKVMLKKLAYRILGN